MKPCIALDKSYLTACSKEKFTEVCNTYRILAPESLIYELLKEPTEVRASLFSKFPETVRPYQVVSNVGTLLRHEITSHTAYGLPSVRNLVRDYSIHRLLVDRSYTLDARQQRLLEAKRAEIELDAEVFLSMLDPLRKYYQKALSGSDDSRQRNRDALERQIADDRVFLAEQYALVEIDPLLFPGFSKASFELMNERWASYRWLQVQNLFALDLCFRYPNSATISRSGKAFEKLKHDILDAHYLIIALLEGGLATNEHKLIRWWQLLKPYGILLTVKP